MKAFNRILFFLAAAFSIVADSAFGSVDPYERGEFQVGATTILRVEAVQLDHNLRVFAPNTTGTFKVAYFLGGFDGECELAYRSSKQ